MVSASSPEVDIGDHIKVKREGLPGLRLISMDEGMSREERERECKSPEIPVCCPVPVKGEYTCILVQGTDGLLLCHFKNFKPCSHVQTPKDTEIWSVKVLTLCQLLTGWMGSTPILPVKVSITIGTMLKLERAEFRCRYV